MTLTPRKSASAACQRGENAVAGRCVAACRRLLAAAASAVPLYILYSLAGGARCSTERIRTIRRKRRVRRAAATLPSASTLYSMPHGRQRPSRKRSGAVHRSIEQQHRLLLHRPRRIPDPTGPAGGAREGAAENTRRAPVRDTSAKRREARPTP